MSDSSMPDEKQKRPPVKRDVGFFRRLWEQIRLSWGLFFDPQVPILLKTIPVVMGAYILSPIDISPDVVPLIGQIDDLSVLLLGLSMFTSMAPKEIVAQHLARMRGEPVYIVEAEAERIIDTEAEPK